jgi:hypothetical protein
MAHTANTYRGAPSLADAGAEITSLSAVLGVVTMALFPFALPGLLLFVVLPLILVAVPGLVLVGLLVVPVGLIRVVRRSRSRRGGRLSVGPAEQHPAAGQGATGRVGVAG